MLEENSAQHPAQPEEQAAVIHLVNRELDWRLSETERGVLTDGLVFEDLQRDRVHQIVQWLQHFPERLPQMEALTSDGRKALQQARDHAQNRDGWRRGPRW